MTNFITLVRGDDTNFNNANFLTINFNTEILDLSTFSAKFTLGNVVKTFDDLSSGSITINFSSSETANLPTTCYGILRLIDNSGRVGTVESIIPFKVVSQVHGNAIATEPYTLNFDVEQGGETILNVSVESAVSVEVGETTTLPAGSDATVTNSGTFNHLVLDFGIPKGADGEDGRSATIAVGETTTGEAGTEASVVNTGTSLDAVFDFTIPRGEKGEKGDCNFATFDVENGYLIMNKDDDMNIDFEIANGNLEVIING